MRRLAAIASAGLLLAGMALTAIFTGPVASAHATRVSAEPVDNAVLTTGPDRVSATFNERLQTTFAAMTVVGSRWQPVVDRGNQRAGSGCRCRPATARTGRHLHGELPGDVCRRPRGVGVLVVSADGGRDRHTRTRPRSRQYRRRLPGLAVRGGSSGAGRCGRIVDGAAQTLTVRPPNHRGASWHDGFE